ncbi:MAG: hypothetical protein AABY18_08645 [Candidatus Thermoplasmatota archaeon]
MDELPAALEDVRPRILPRVPAWARFTFGLGVLPLLGLALILIGVTGDTHCTDKTYIDYSNGGTAVSGGCTTRETATRTAYPAGATLMAASVLWVDTTTARSRWAAIVLRVAILVASLAFALTARALQWPAWVGLVGLLVPLGAVVVAIVRRAVAERKASAAAPSRA